MTNEQNRVRYEQRVGWHGNIPEGHYAIPDPHEPERITMWRVRNGLMIPWPRKTRQGPIAYRSDIPRDPHARQAWVRDHADRCCAYRDEVEQAISASPPTAAARYAAVTFRCAVCNRALKTPESNAYGVGPECRSWMPDELLARYAQQVSILRAAIEKPARRDTHPTSDPDLAQETR